MHMGDHACCDLVTWPVIVSTHMLHHIVCSAERSRAAGIRTLVRLLICVDGANMTLEMLTASELSGEYVLVTTGGKRETKG